MAPLSRSGGIWRGALPGRGALLRRSPRRRWQRCSVTAADRAQLAQGVAARWQIRLFKALQVRCATNARPGVRTRGERGGQRLLCVAVCDVHSPALCKRVCVGGVDVKGISLYVRFD